MEMVNSVSAQQSLNILQQYLVPQQTPTPTPVAASSTSNSAQSGSGAAVQSTAGTFQQLASDLQSLLLQQQSSKGADDSSGSPTSGGDRPGMRQSHAGGSGSHAAEGGASGSSSPQATVTTKINPDGTISTITTNADGTQTITTSVPDSASQVSKSSAPSTDVAATAANALPNANQPLTDEIAKNLMRNFLSGLGERNKSADPGSAATQQDPTIG
jgi:hypothetical protein